MDADTDALAEATLFDLERPPPVSLADKFGVPPMSVLDRRSGHWQDRKRRWLCLGIRSELGRGRGLIYGTWSDTGGRNGAQRPSAVTQMHHDYQGGSSIFDPGLCELVYRWLTAPGGRVLDPFAGGSVRGVVASVLGRYYLGVDLSAAQVAANQSQTGLGSEIAPAWVVGDACRVGEVLTPADEFDLLFTCPPYADLEVYSDASADLSAMPYEVFRAAHAHAIAAAVARLRRDRFAAWVISDVRDRRGMYRGLVGDTVAAFRRAGMDLYNDAVVLDQVGTAALRAERAFVATRKLARTHQHLLVFVKGDPKRATAWAAGGGDLAVDMPARSHAMLAGGDAAKHDG